MSLAPFKSSTASYKKILHRFMLSVAILNILPILYFAYFLLNLSKITLEDNSSNSIFPLGYIVPILLVFGISLGVYGFSRLWVAIVVCKPFWFYTEYELTQVIWRKDERVTFKRHWFQHLFPSFYYILVPVLAFYIVTLYCDGIIVSGIILGVMIFLGVITKKRNQSCYRDI